MKKIFTIVVAFLMILPCVFCCDAKEVYDVNLDGKATAEDARFILRCSIGLEKYTAEQFLAGDTDADGMLTAADARNVLRYAVGLSVDAPEAYALDSLTVKVKKEYVVDDTFEIALLANENVKDCGVLLRAEDGGLYVVIYLKKAGKENLQALKEYYEGLSVVEFVELNPLAYTD